MKTTKKTVKNVKKATKPSFVVDLTDAVTYSDVKLSFIEAKALNGVKLTQDEFNFVMLISAGSMLNVIDTFIDECLTCIPKENVIHDDKLAKDIVKMIEKKVNKKQPWYKRAWNWITKPFRKNK